MDHIELQWHDHEIHHLGPGKELHILINGQSLIDLVRSIELPFAELEDSPDIAGAYSWLIAEYCEIQRLTTEECMVLGCNCGIPECWPLATRVSFSENVVNWSNFRNWHTESRTNPWDYSALGPFTFDRQQYETAVRGLLKPT